METENTTTTTDSASQGPLKLNGMFAFKLGMSTFFNEAGAAIPVTVLKTGDWTVTQVKTKQKDGYSAVQLAHGIKKEKRAADAAVGHFKKSGLKNAPQYVGEIRQELPEGVKLGQVLSLESLAVGDFVKVAGRSKGRGFAGVVKRYNFAGGPASHGSGFHRAPGSSGQRTWPGRIMPGKRFPGHYGDANVTVKGLEVVGVFPEESVVFVKGSIPGAPRSLVQITKE